MKLKLLNITICLLSFVYLTGFGEPTPAFFFCKTVECVELAVENGADFNKNDKYFSTPLREASVHGRSEVINALLAAGADVNGTSKNGRTPLMSASNLCKLDIINQLIAAGAIVNRASGYGNTALMLGARCKDVDIINTLLEEGANVHDVNAYGYNALRFAVVRGRLNAVEVLLDAGATEDAFIHETTALIISVRRGHSDIVRTLIARGVDINARDDRGKTALRWAEEKGRTEIAEFLRANGATF